jgi:hypothetical protein
VATHLHLVPRLRTSGAVPPLPKYIFMAWCLIKQWMLLCGVVLSYMGGQNLPFSFHRLGLLGSRRNELCRHLVGLLDGGLGHHEACTYTGQNSIIKMNIHLCHEWDSDFLCHCVSGPCLSWTAWPLWLVF